MLPQALLLRPARPADARALARLYRLGFARYGGTPLDDELVGRAVVAEAEGAVVGLGLLDPVDDGLRHKLARARIRRPWPARGDHHLSALVVDPDWRRRGVGRALALARIEIAELRGASRVFVQCVDGSGSLDLYTSLGFRALLHLDHCYADGTGATLMSAPLPWVGPPPG